MSEQNITESKDEISLQQIISSLLNTYRYFLSKGLKIFIIAVIGALLGLVYAIISKPVYFAECTFVLEEGDSGGGLGAYAGLASMMGLDLGSGGGGIFQGDNIIQLYESRKMIEKTLLSQDTFDGKQDLIIHRFIQYNKLREKWESKTNLQNIRFDINKDKFTIQHDSIISLIVKSINKEFLNVIKPDKKLSILKVEFKSKDEQFAKSFVDNIVYNVSRFYIQTKTKKSTQNITILEKQADSVKKVLNNSLRGVAAAVDANPNINPAFQALRVPSQRRQVDVQASGAVYQEIVKSLEMAKVSFRKETPLIQIIDEPILPLKKETTSKVLSLILGAFLASFIFMIYLLLVRKSLK